jgi:hypothetical protein
MSESGCEERVAPCIRSRSASAVSIISIPYGYRGDNCEEICPNPISNITFGRFEHRFNINACVCGCLESQIFHYGVGSYGYFNINEDTLNIDCSLTTSIPISVTGAISVDTPQLFYGDCESLPIENFANEEICANTSVSLPDPRIPDICRVTIDIIASSSLVIPFTIYHNASGSNRSNLSIVLYQFFEVARGFGYIHIQIITIISYFNACVREFIGVFDPNLANTKEDFEVMRGLWNGLYAYREWHDTHVVKRAKLVDMV